MTDTVNQADALIQRIADFHVEAVPNGAETICIRNSREIAESLRDLFMGEHPRDEKLADKLATELTKSGEAYFQDVQPIISYAISRLWDMGYLTVSPRTVPQKAASVAMAYSDWSSWSGGEPPIAYGSSAEVIRKNGETVVLQGRIAGLYETWRHHGNGLDIICYREIIRTSQPVTEAEAEREKLVGDMARAIGNVLPDGSSYSVIHRKQALAALAVVDRTKGGA